MLRLTNLALNQPVDPIVITAGNRYSDATNKSSYTFSSCDLGSDVDNRMIVVCVHHTGNVSLSGFTHTCAGVDMHRAHSARYTTTGAPYSGCAILAVALNKGNGATGDVVITFDGTATNCEIDVYVVYNAGSSGVTPTGEESAANFAQNTDYYCSFFGFDIYPGDIVAWAFQDDEPYSDSGTTEQQPTIDSDAPMQIGLNGLSSSPVTKIMSGCNKSVNAFPVSHASYGITAEPDPGVTTTDRLMVLVHWWGG